MKKKTICEHCKGTGSVPQDIDLRLTPDQAQAIADVLAHVGGDPLYSRRKITNEVIRKLRSEGYEWSMTRDDMIEGRFFFKKEI